MLLFVNVQTNIIILLTINARTKVNILKSSMRYYYHYQYTLYLHYDLKIKLLFGRPLPSNPKTDNIILNNSTMNYINRYRYYTNCLPNCYELQLSIVYDD